MKKASTVRFDSTLAVAFLFVCALLRPSAVQGETVLGPGPVPVPVVHSSADDYRIVPGAELVSTTADLSADGKHLNGREAIFTYGGTYLMEGGRVEGATVALPTGVESANGGQGIRFIFEANLEMHGGVIKGGSVMLDGAGGAGFPAPAISNRYQSRPNDIKIFGGTIEGGTLRQMSSPDVIVEQAPAIVIGTDYYGLLDIYGGQIIGGISFTGSTSSVIPFRTVIHGSDFNFQPPLVNERLRPGVPTTISGKYLDGAPFSLVVQSLYKQQRVMYEVDALVLGVPEPSGMALLVAAGIFGGLRSRLASSFSPRSVTGGVNCAPRRPSA